MHLDYSLWLWHFFYSSQECTATTDRRAEEYRGDTWRRHIKHSQRTQEVGCPPPASIECGGVVTQRPGSTSTCPLKVQKTKLGLVLCRAGNMKGSHLLKLECHSTKYGKVTQRIEPTTPDPELLNMSWDKMTQRKANTSKVLPLHLKHYNTNWGRVTLWIELTNVAQPPPLECHSTDSGKVFQRRGFLSKA
jgi:hypothetical protein